MIEVTWWCGRSKGLRNLWAVKLSDHRSSIIHDSFVRGPRICEGASARFRLRRVCSRTLEAKVAECANDDGGDMSRKPERAAFGKKIEGTMYQ